MEQHPVPQNVTTFQFRLVGDMTIKQFGYLAGGIIGGYISYKLPLPFFFTWPLAISLGLLGFGLAFVPVEERPMDVWVASFFKNIYNPTQWVWQKEKRAIPIKSAPTPPPHVPQKLQPAPVHTPPPPTTATSAILSVHHTANPLDWFRSLFQSKQKAAPSLSPGFSFADALAREPQKPAPPPAPPPVGGPTTPTNNSPSVSPSLEKRGVGGVTDRVVELQMQLSDALSQRERMEKELIAMRQTLGQQSKNAAQAPLRQASMAPSPASTSAPSVRVIAPGAASKAGLPKLTTFPNVVTGIIKDHFGNLLAGMLITVRDRDDVPLRALKTNKLGQFAASTPLSNNTYIVEIEDPKGTYTFDKAQISLNGTVAPLIEVTAKSQREIERDKLAKEIFGNQIQ